MQITYRKTTDLIPYAKNARVHSDGQVEQIAASIKEFGFNNPILTDGANGVIAGHARLQAAIKLGLDEVPTIELSHLTETQKRAYILADNRLAEYATWDFELVRLELKDLAESGFDIDLTGFELKLDDGQSTQAKPNEISLDDFSEEKFNCECPRCKFKFNV